MIFGTFPIQTAVWYVASNVVEPASTIVATLTSGAGHEDPCGSVPVTVAVTKEPEDILARAAEQAKLPVTIFSDVSQ